VISVRRTLQPKVLKKNANQWLSKLQEISGNPLSTKQQRENAQNKYRHNQIKDALAKMFHGKCVYCESKITVVTYGAIEHFKPKGLYPDLTFDWNNLLLSCDICNDAGHKGTKFPIDDIGHPLLLDPTDGITDPNNHLDFSWDSVTGLSSIYGLDERGKAVETIFDLNGRNGRQDLIVYRSKYIKKLFALLRLAQTGDREAIDLLHEACRPTEEYSAFSLKYIFPHLP
jgi:uncharacterized protein (TIGR02646 family)